MNDLEPKGLLSSLLEGRGTIWLAILAIWGGTASYIGRQRKMNKQFRLVELIGEWIISGFAGVVVAYVCYEFQFSWSLTCFMSGIAGHMGGRAIYLLESRFKKIVGKHDES